MKLLMLIFSSFILLQASAAILEKSIVEKNRAHGEKKKKFLFVTLDKEAASTQINIGLKSLDKLPPERRAYFKDIIKAAANEWSRHAAVDFNFIKTGSKIRPHFEIMVYASQIESKSRIGRSSHGSVNFTEKVINLNLPSDSSRGSHYKVALHEFGHVLGFKHEHQHPDREFSFDFDLLLSKCGLGSKEVCRRSIQYNSMKTFSGKAYEVKDYDIESIMHYGVSQPLIKENIEIKESMSLSLGDKIAVAEAYPGRRSINEVIENHQNEEKIKSAGIIGKCSVYSIDSNDFRYNYQNESEAHFIDETFENATTNASLDPKCLSSSR